MNFLMRTSLKLEALSVRGLGGEKVVSLDPGGGEGWRWRGRGKAGVRHSKIPKCLNFQKLNFKIHNIPKSLNFQTLLNSKHSKFLYTLNFFTL